SRLKSIRLISARWSRVFNSWNGDGAPVAPSSTWARNAPAEPLALASFVNLSRNAIAISLNFSRTIRSLHRGLSNSILWPRFRFLRGGPDSSAAVPFPTPRIRFLGRGAFFVLSPAFQRGKRYLIDPPVAERRLSGDFQ